MRAAFGLSNALLTGDMVNPVQVGKTVSAEVLGCTEKSPKSERPFADALNEAMVTEKDGDVKPVATAADNAAEEAIGQTESNGSNRNFADDPGSEITAILATLGSTQPATAPLETRCGAEAGRSIDAPSAEEPDSAPPKIEKFLAEDSSTEMSARLTRLGSVQGTMAVPQRASIAGEQPAVVSEQGATDRLTQQVSANTTVAAKAFAGSAAAPSSLPDENPLGKRIPGEMTEISQTATDTQGQSDAQPVQAAEQDATTSTFQASTNINVSEQAQDSLLATTIGDDLFPHDAKPARDGHSTLPNVATEITSGSDIVNGPNVQAKNTLTNAESGANTKPALHSLDELIESPANPHSQGEEVVAPVDRPRDQHAGSSDVRRKPLAIETEQQKDISVPPESVTQKAEIQTRTSDSATSSALAATTGSVSPAVTVMPAVVITAEHVDVARQKLSGPAVPAGNTGLPTQSVSTATVAVDIAHAREVIQSARMLERLGRSEMQVGINTDMGHVEVRTVLENAHISASFGVERSELGALIAAELPSLQHALAKNHLDLSSASVNTAGGGTQGDAGRNAQQQRNQNGTPGYTLPAIYPVAEKQGNRTSPLLATGNNSEYLGGLSVRV